MRRLHIAMLLLLLSTTTSFANEKQRVSAVDFISVPMLTSAALSPDGKLLLYRHTNVDWQENLHVARLRLRNLASNALLAVPEPESQSESFGLGVWRPDSTGFALILKREQDDHRQIYFFDRSTGLLTRLTEHSDDIESVLWSQDGEQLYFVAKTERDANQARLLDADWLIRGYDDDQNRSIWQLNIATGVVRELVGGDFSIKRVTLSRDGEFLVYTRLPGHELNRAPDGEIWATHIESGRHVRWTDNSFSEYGAQLSPDGAQLAYIATVNAEGETYFEDKVFVQHGAGSQPRRLLADAAMEALRFAWDASGRGLYILGNVGVTSQLFHYDLRSDALTQLTNGEHTFNDWHYDASLDRHVAKHITPDSPGDFATIDANSGRITPLTSEARDWAARYQLPEQTLVTWRGGGRQTIEGVLVYPVGYESGKRYPLVTIIHGGPRSSAQFGSWNRSRYVAVLAGQGYAVLLPNHRGGTGYGDAFMRDMAGRYFRNAHQDVLDGVDAMVARGIADPDQLIAMGWSAGGHMVNKLITITDRFAAASSGAGASDWLSMYGESDIRHSRTPVFGGTPWQRNAPIKRFRRDSPLQDSWRVTTPTLFFVGEQDKRVPPTQSIMMYRGVRAADVPTALYIAPGQPHNYRKPSYQLFKINRELAWYAEHALDAPYEAVLPTAADAPLSTPDTEDPS